MVTIEMNFPLRKRINDWVKKNRLEAFIIALILIISSFFRLYKIDEYMTFLGDEGRDAIVVRRLLVNFDPILIGPRTSIGDMYLGPLYYYLMAPPLFLGNFSPVGPSVMVAILGVITVFFVWWVAREWFGRLAGFVAALFYSISPTIIVQSRSSWNPYIMPFFSLLSIYSIWRVWSFSKVTGRKVKNFKWLIILGVSLAFVLQSHYLGLLLLPTIGLFWILSFLKLKSLTTQEAGKNFFLLKEFLKNSIVGGVIFLLLMSPLVVFDARHEWRNFVAMKRFFLERQTTISARPWTAIPKLWPISQKITTQLVAGTNEVVGGWVAVGIVLGTLWIIASFIYSNKLLLYGMLSQFFRQKNKKFIFFSHSPFRRISQNFGSLNKMDVGNPYLLLFSWIFFALLGLGVYKQEIYDHYYGFFFSAPFLLMGGFVHNITFCRKKFFLTRFLVYFLLFTALLVLIIVNLFNNPLRYPPNRQLQRTEEVARKITDEARGKKFNLAVIAERNYEDAYQYFLESWGEPVIDIDPLNYENTVSEQLFVVCELPKEKCDPTKNPKAEIANFGWSRVEGEWEVGGTTLYKLVHAQ